MMRSFALLLIVLTVGSFLGGCSDTSAGTEEPTVEISEPEASFGLSGDGRYLDGPVEGVHYLCGTFEGWTDSRGAFTYEVGKGCTFSIGSLRLRTVDGTLLTKKQVILQETDTRIAQFLLSLDVDPDPDRIQLDALLAQELNGPEYDTWIDRIDLATLLNELRASLERKGIIHEPVQLTLPEQAHTHLRRTYAIYCHEAAYRLIDEGTDLGTCPSLPAVPSEANGTASEHIGTESDTTPPTIALNGPEHMTVHQGDTFIDPGATAMDGQDGVVDVRVEGRVDMSVPGTYVLTYRAEDRAGNGSQTERTVVVLSNVPYPHLPTRNDLTDTMAVKFLNMATFGATPEQVAELKNMGVEAWVDHYLGMAYNDRTDSLLRKVIQRCITIDYKSFDSESHTVDEWLNDGIIYRNQLRYFNQRKINGIHEIDHHFSLLFDQQIRGRNQLRQRVAYALSQIIIASESNDNFFYERGEALSYYYDLLMKYAFGNYGDLLYDVSMSPTMATFLTYASNPKAFVDPDTNSTILPDENYGREIMQLFTIGLYELNMDGTEKRRDGKRIPTYEQEDVNNMSRVFTGLHYNNSQWGDTTFAADMTHPLVCDPQYHDSGPKTVLGITLQGSDDCAQDVRAAVDMLMQHPNVAPFVAKKLILRLTKSNPTTAYIRRVADVFATTHGDLGQTVKAILLDPEIWENIKEDRGTKIKEPYLAFTQMVRALAYKPLPTFYWTIPSNKTENAHIDDPGFILDAYTRFPLYAYFGQFPTHSPSVFNFYDDEFVPDDSEFKIRGFVAPELEIITPKYAVAYNNFVSTLLYEASVPRVLERYGSTATPENDPKAYHADRTYMYQEYTEAMPIADANHFYDGDLSASEKTAARERMATALVDLYSQKLLGKKLDTDQRQAIIDHYRDLNRWSTQGSKSDAYRRREFVQFFVRPIVLDILHTDTYMVN